jgi:hypothetical protein
VAALFMVAPAQASGPGAAPSVASGDTVTVLVTPATRPDPYNAATVGDQTADQLYSGRRNGKTDSVHGRVARSGHVNQDLPAVSGVVADVTPDQLAALTSQSDLVVTPDVSVSMADSSLGGHLGRHVDALRGHHQQHGQ